MEKNIPKLGPKVPFSTYDIFVYLSPPIMIFICIYLFERSLVKHKILELTTPVYSFLDSMLKSASKEAFNWGAILALLICLICIVYIVGHLLATFSSLIIDRVLVYKGYGYPYENMLEIKIADYKLISRKFYRGSFFWINFILLVFYFHKCVVFFNLPELLFPIVIYILLVLFFLFIILKLIFSARYHNESTIPAAWKKIFTFFSWPYDLLSGFLATYINPRRAINPGFVREFKKQFKYKFSLNSDESETNNFWLPYIHVSENSVNMGAALTNWLNLYSLSRNLSFSFYLLFLYSGFVFSFQIGRIELKMHGAFFIFPISMFILSLILLIRFYYLYSSYYTKYTLRAFYVLQKEKNIPRAPSNRRRIQPTVGRGVGQRRG